MSRAYKAKANDMFKMSLKLDRLMHAAGNMALLGEKLGIPEAVEKGKEIRISLYNEGRAYRDMFANAKKHQEAIRELDIDGIYEARLNEVRNLRGMSKHLEAVDLKAYM